MIVETVDRDAPEFVPASPELDEEEPPSPPPPLTSKAQVARGVWPVIAVVVVLTLLFLLFEGPVQHEWFSSRQRNLSADFDVKRPNVAPGHAEAVLQVPSLGVNLMVVEGEDAANLRGGPGHRLGTPPPGKRGNSIIVGHEHAWSGPFKDLHKLHKGSFIVAQAHLGKPIVFTVVSVRHVGRDAPKLVAPSTDYRLTLVTSDGGRFSHDHLVVSAVSGTVGKLRHPSAADHLDPERASPFSLELGIAFLAFGLAVIGVLYLGPRYGRGAVAFVVIPLALAGLLAVFLDLDRVFPPLR